MDFYHRQEEARQASRWLVAAFAAAVLLVVLSIDLVILAAVAVWSADSLVFLAPGEWFDRNAASFGVVALVVAASIAGPSLWKTAQLRSGGWVVARDMGARRIQAATDVPEERRLLNVVEEMAIASSVPVPAVYILRSTAVNALTAGIAPSSAALIVTLGALEALERDELQGVVAHEFSHILNGDMRLNTRLVGFLHGLFIVTELGRLLTPDVDHQSNRRGDVWLLGYAILGVSVVGLLAGRALQASVARQRERLADASAVQFTRQSRGLRNALVKIGAHRYGSRLNHHAVDRVCHMLFASSGVLDFATHPPLTERIRALDPSFRTEEFGRVRRQLDDREAGAGTPAPAGQDAVLAVPAGPEAIAALVGNPGPREVRIAAGIRAALPPAVSAAATDDGAALVLLLALAIGDRDEANRVDFVRAQLGDSVARDVRAALPIARALPLGQRLPATLLLMGPLRELDRAPRQALVSVLNGLMLRAGTSSVLGYALRRAAMTFLGDGLVPVALTSALPLRSATEDLRVVLSVLARSGDGRDAAVVRTAFERGWSQLGLPQRSMVTLPESWVGPMDRAVLRLDRLSPGDKGLVIRALSATALHDERLNVAEAELLRLLCAVLHCPLPPLLEGVD